MIGVSPGLRVSPRRRDKIDVTAHSVLQVAPGIRLADTDASSVSSQASLNAAASARQHSSSQHSPPWHWHAAAIIM
jgi:hypothetical protein